MGNTMEKNMDDLTPIVYSSKLREMLVKHYPEYTEALRLLDEGSPWLGRYLENSWGAISIEDVMSAYDILPLREKAMAIINRKGVYSQWVLEWDEYCQNAEVL